MLARAGSFTRMYCMPSHPAHPYWPEKLWQSGPDCQFRPWVPTNARARSRLLLRPTPRDVLEESLTLNIVCMNSHQRDRHGSASAVLQRQSRRPSVFAANCFVAKTGVAASPLSATPLPLSSWPGCRQISWPAILKPATPHIDHETSPLLLLFLLSPSSL